MATTKQTEIRTKASRTSKLASRAKAPAHRNDAGSAVGKTADRAAKTTRRAPATALPKTASSSSSARTLPDKPTATTSKADDSALLFRSGTKSATVIDLLRSERGATVAEMISATGWQAHSVRGFLSGSLKKKLGLNVSSIKDAEGERRYRIAS